MSFSEEDRTFPVMGGDKGYTTVWLCLMLQSYALKNNLMVNAV